jgi:hypothetical protein
MRGDQFGSKTKGRILRGARNEQIVREETRHETLVYVSAVDAALALVAGKPIEKKVDISFRLVTSANMDQSAKKN